MDYGDNLYKHNNLVNRKNTQRFSGFVCQGNKSEVWVGMKLVRLTVVQQLGAPAVFSRPRPLAHNRWPVGAGIRARQAGGGGVSRVEERRDVGKEREEKKRDVGREREEKRQECKRG